MIFLIKYKTIYNNRKIYSLNYNILILHVWKRNVVCPSSKQCCKHQWSCFPGFFLGVLGFNYSLLKQLLFSKGVVALVVTEILIPSRHVLRISTKGFPSISTTFCLVYPTNNIYIFLYPTPMTLELCISHKRHVGLLLV